MAIEAEHYGETRTRLAADPVVRGMALDIAEGLRAGYVTMDELVHASTLSPRFGFHAELQRAVPVPDHR